MSVPSAAAIAFPTAPTAVIVGADGVGTGFVGADLVGAGFVSALAVEPFGRLITSPTLILFAFFICGLACINCASVTPLRFAIFESVSPDFTV